MRTRALDVMPVDRPLAATLIVPTVGFCLLFTIGTGRFMAFSLFLAVLVICCWLFAWRSRCGVSVKLRAPSRVLEGASTELNLAVTCHAWLPRFVAATIVEFKGVGLAREALAAASESEGGSYRQRLSPVSGSHKARVDGFVLHRGTTEVCRELALPHRGQVTVQALHLRFADPLGIFALNRRFPLAHQILIRVRPAAGGSMLRFTGSSGRLETHRRVNDTGEVSEFAGTRPYRPGDELRHIHWPAVARTGELFVREYTQGSAESVVVLLLRQPGAQSETCRTGEFALKTATALVMELYDRRVHVCFGSNITQHSGLGIGHSRRNLQRFHDDISTVDWRLSAANTDFLGHLEVPRQDDPWCVIFCADAAALETAASVPSLLQLAPDRMIAVCDHTASARVPPGLRVVRCEDESPAALFSRLVL